METIINPKLSQPRLTVAKDRSTLKLISQDDKMSAFAAKVVAQIANDGGVQYTVRGTIRRDQNSGLLSVRLRDESGSFSKFFEEGGLWNAN